MAVTEQSYTGNGSTTNYSFTFPYLKSTDIEVQVDAAVTTAWSLANATTVQFNSAPANGAAIKILRKTNVDNLTATFYAGSAIKSEDLNDNFTQNLYVTQEVGNRSFENTGLSTMIGHLQMGEDTTIKFEGATDNANETTLTVVDPTADRTITLPNVTGTVVTTGDTGTVATGMIAADAITGAKIADDSIDSEHYVNDSIDTAHIADGQVTSAKIADATIVDGDIQANAGIAHTKLANGTAGNVLLINSSSKVSSTAVSGDVLIDSSGVTSINTGVIVAADIAADAVTGAKIADDQIDSEHYIDGSIDSAHIANDQIDSQHYAAGSIDLEHMSANSVDSDQYVDGSIDSAHIANDQIDSQHYAAGSIDLEHMSANSVDSDQYVDGSVDRIHLEADIIDSTKLADDAVGTEHIADAELTTLAGMQSGTASILAGSTALAATLTEINTICDGKGVETTITDDDTKYPTSGAVVDYVAAQIAPIGGLEVIANKDSFPETQPAAGVVISIADAVGIVVNGSGTSTTPDTITTDATVTINNINSSFNSATVASGVGWLVTSTGSGQIYNYHKANIKEADVVQLSDDINDFNSRYRINAGEPSSNNDDGDLVWDTNADKMKVYDGTASAWKEVTSSGDFKYLFLCPAGGTGAPTINGSIATYDLREGSNSGSAASVTSAAQLLVSINGVIQKANTGTSAPAEGFALVDSNTIIFSASLPNGASVFIVQSGSAISIPTPGDNTVSTVKLQSGSVTLAKIASQAVDEDNLYIDNAGSNGQFLSKQSGGTGGLLWATPTQLTEEEVEDFVGGMVTGNTETGITVTYEDSDGTLDFVVDDTTKMPLAGGTFTGNVYFESEIGMINGTTNAARYIDVGLGDNNALTIRGCSGGDANHETLATFTRNGGVSLYFDTTNEFETKSGGVKLYGHSEQIVTALTSASTVTIDFSLSNHFSCTMGHNITFANPSTESIGQSGTITLTQDGTGSRTAAWGTQFLWAGGTAPTLTTTANAVDRIDYVVVAADKIHCVATLALD